MLTNLDPASTYSVIVYAEIGSKTDCGISVKGDLVAIGYETGCTCKFFPPVLTESKLLSMMKLWLCSDADI